MEYLYIITGLALLASLAADRGKTVKGLEIALKRFMKILPAFLTMLVSVSVILFFLPGSVIYRFLSATGLWAGLAAAVVLGSVTLMPGFIAFPLCGILLAQGVPYMVLSGFTTTLMMVGIVTYPIEKELFGNRLALYRNLVSLGIAIIVALVTGLVFGELG